MADDELYKTPRFTPVCALDSKEAFQGLTAKEKLYAYHLSTGSWAGSLTCLVQTSPESPRLFQLLYRLFAGDNLDVLEDRASKSGVTGEQWQDFLQYCSCFFGNMGNYLSFGDTKLVPRCTSSTIRSIVAGSSKSDDLLKAWDSIADDIYDLSPSKRQLGLDGKGISTYYSADITTEEIKLVQAFLGEQKLGDQAYNTRLFKKSLPDKSVVYELAIASGEAKPRVSHVFQSDQKSINIDVIYGDHSPFMTRLADCIEKAKEFVPEDRSEQKSMLTEYVKHFRGGAISAHKDSQRNWVKDRAPPVETNIGFIESYRDPFGVRGEFEGFVAVVNREQSKKFQHLVDNAQPFIAMLPWPSAFEKDQFLRPDFTSLDVITFASSGIPAGINIPNYDDIRQDFGFKNVSLGNVLSASAPSEKITFLSAEDEAVFRAWRGRSFEVQVALHELLGHGSGKLLRQDEAGALNFDPAQVTHPLTGGAVMSYYKPGETWDSKFGAVSSSYEECRAECVGLHLCSLGEVLTIFGYDTAQLAAGDVHDVTYGNWLIMVRAGLLALEYYSPETASWRQAHMQARYVILRVLLEAGGGLVGVSGERIELDRAKILSVGRPAIAAFLQKLNVYKATADVEAGAGMYGAYSAVPPDLMALRQAVLDQKQPRKLFVQPVMALDDAAGVTYKDYPPSAEGMVQSFVERFAPGGPLGDLVDHLARCGQFPFPAA